jgi:hypothetical protein
MTMIQQFHKCKFNAIFNYIDNKVQLSKSITIFKLENREMGFFD